MTESAGTAQGVVEAKLRGGGGGGEGKERVKREIRSAGTRGPFLWGPKMCSGGPLPQGFVRK